MDSNLRKDYDRLKYVERILNDNYEWLQTHVNEEEDYETDIQCTTSALTFGFEVKTISSSYGGLVDNDYWTTKSARGDKWRWCTSASTQEEFWADRTPSPDFGDTPIQMLNAYDKYGRRKGAKLTKLLDNRDGLIYLAKDGMLIFSPKALREAIIGYGWVYLPHHKELNDKSCKFEYKALIDLSRGRFLPLNNIPKELIESVK